MESSVLAFYKNWVTVPETPPDMPVKIMGVDYLPETSFIMTKWIFMNTLCYLSWVGRVIFYFQDNPNREALLAMAGAIVNFLWTSMLEAFFHDYHFKLCLAYLGGIVILHGFFYAQLNAELAGHGHRPLSRIWATVLLVIGACVASFIQTSSLSSPKSRVINAYHYTLELTRFFNSAGSAPFTGQNRWKKIVTVAKSILALLVCAFFVRFVTLYSEIRLVLTCACAFVISVCAEEDVSDENNLQDLEHIEIPNEQLQDLLGDAPVPERSSEITEGVNFLYSTLVAVLAHTENIEINMKIFIYKYESNLKRFAFFEESCLIDFPRISRELCRQIKHTRRALRHPLMSVKKSVNNNELLRLSDLVKPAIKLLEDAMAQEQGSPTRQIDAPQIHEAAIAIERSYKTLKYYHHSIAATKWALRKTESFSEALYNELSRHPNANEQFNNNIRDIHEEFAMIRGCLSSVFSPDSEELDACSDNIVIWAAWLEPNSRVR